MARLSKYDRLKNWLRECGRPQVTLAFAELEKILGFELPESALKYDSWWANSTTGGSQIRAWRDAGWRVEEIDRRGRRVVFRRVAGAPMRRLAAAEGGAGASVTAAGREAAAPTTAPGVAVPPSAAEAPRSAPRRAAPLRSPAVEKRAGPSDEAGGASAALLPPEAAFDLTRLSPRARRLLEMRARRNGRKAGAELARIVADALAAEDRLVRAELRRIRERTQRPGGFDMLDVLGRGGRQS